MNKNFFNNIKNKKKICIISGKNVSKNKIILNFIRKIKKEDSKIFLKLKPYPEYQEIKHLQKKIEFFDPKIIISIGGGSVLDCSKIIYQNISCKKLILIPTTAGSGAEATNFAVLYKNKNKYSIKIKKKFEFYLFPQLTINVPKSVRSSSAFDALAQCIESVLSQGSNKKSILYSQKGINLLINNMYSYYKNPNFINSKLMLLGSNYSGKAINISKTTAPHALSYPFTFYFGVSHGYAVSLFFEKILNYSFIKLLKLNKNKKELQKYRIIFKFFKVKKIEDLSLKIKQLKKKLKLDPKIINNINFNNKINKFKIKSMINSSRLNNHIVKITKNELFELIK